MWILDVQYGYGSRCGKRETVPMYSMSLLECTPEKTTKTKPLYYKFGCAKVGLGTMKTHSQNVKTHSQNVKKKAKQKKNEVQNGMPMLPNVICLWIVPVLCFFFFFFVFSSNWFVILWTCLVVLVCAWNVS